MMSFTFSTHADYVAACEQLAEDLLQFNAEPVELTIDIVKGEVSDETYKWLKLVATQEI